MLNGKRVRLVLLEKRHLPPRVRFINDPEVQATLSFDYPTSEARTEAWFQKIVLATDRVDFAVETIEESRVIGFCGLFHLDRVVRKGEFYIFIGDKSVWGQGYGRDVYRLATNYGFQELGLKRIFLHHIVDNRRGLAATRASGWKVEGILRRHSYSHGSWKDQYICSILPEEWEDNPIYDDV